MKNISLTIAAFFLAFLTFGQITTIPEFPTDQDEVLLTFDATGTPLEGYSGSMYTHTGVILEGSSSWSHVIGNWGDNTVQPQLTGIGNNKWELNISPSIRSFYGVGANAVIRQMAFVFRSADGGTQSADLFVDVFESGLSIIVSQPSSDRVMTIEDDVLKVMAASPLADSMFLFIAGEQVLAIDDIVLEYDIITENIAGYWVDIDVEIIAKDAEDQVSAEFVYFVIPAPETAEMPDGVIDGINYIDDNTVVLVLHAPLKSFAFVLGDFNSWEYNEDYYMKQTPDQERMWLQINNLEAGKEYVFQYEVDGEIRIGDPYAEKVSDPWNDHFITNATYPGLISYPTGLTSGIATVLQTAQEPYEWQTTDFTPPAVEDMVIYELLIRDFTEQHTYQSLIDSMDYFLRLGVNVIELMPVNEFEGNISWGYNPNYYFAPDKYYGPRHKLKEFIDVCHANGIAVVLDIVLNHSFNTSPMVMLYFDPNAGQWGKPTPENPWFLVDCPHEPWCWGNTFDQDSPHVHEFFNRVVEHWLTEYRFDGFRFDFTKGFTNVQSGNQGWNYDAARVANLKRIADHAWSVNPDALVILEHFTDNNEEKELADYGMLIWGNMNHTYNEATMGWVNNSNFDWISYQQRGWNDPHLIGYMESHDEQRLMYKNYQFGNSAPGYSTRDTLIALERMALAANFFFTIPGPKMIWMFGEYGYDVDIDFNGRTGPKPIRWYYLDDYHREYLFHVYAALIQLKKEYDVFRTQDYTLSLAGANKSIILRHEEMDVVVLGNFGLTETSITPQWPELGAWYEFYTQTEFDVPHDNVVVTLEPGEYKLFSSVKIEKPEWLNTSVDEIDHVAASQNFRVYPNPSKGDFNFVMNIDHSGDVTLNVYDMFGKQVRSEQYQAHAGENTFTWNAGETLRPGIYFATMTFGAKLETIKLVVE